MINVLNGQIELMVNTRKRPQARENARDAIPAPGHFRYSIENCSKTVFYELAGDHTLGL